MTSFAYSSGNPANLTGGHSASMSDISGPFGDITTFINGGNLDAGNLAANAVGTSELQALSVTGAKIAADTIDTANLATAVKPVTILTPYRTVWQVSSALQGTNVAASYYPTKDGTGVANGAAGSIPEVLVVTPADFAVSGLNTRFRLVVATLVNGTAPASNFTYGLFPVTASSGSAGQYIITMGTAVSGSTVTRITPGANSQSTDTTSDFTIASAGVYAIGVATNATISGNSNVWYNARLEAHHIS